MNTVTKTDEFKRAFFLGFAFVLGVDFARKFGDKADENEYIINCLGAFDDAPFDESKVKRDRKGRFATKGHSGVSSILHAFRKDGDNKYAEGKAPTRQYFKSLPKLGALDTGKVKEALKPFMSAQKLKGDTIKQLDSEKLYKRGEVLYEGKRKPGEPQFVWTQGGKELSKDEALKLEEAMIALKATNVFSTLTKDVKVRPDFASSLGQLATGTLQGGKEFQIYSPDTRLENDRKRHQGTEVLMNSMPKIVKQINKDIDAGKPEAILAYFIHQTLTRAGSSKTDSGSLGATKLLPEHFRIEDGKLICKFHAKNGWWTLEIKDKFLKDYITKKLKTAEAGKPLFGVTYKRLTDYMKNMSERAGLSQTMYPHDFRRVTATQHANDYLQASIKEDPSILKDEEKYSRICAEAINYAANALNDSAPIVFERYIAPQVFFKDRPDLSDAYLRAHAGKGE